jgi:GH24 family phage-related lysozyme (muramidase)
MTMMPVNREKPRFYPPNVLIHVPVGNHQKNEDNDVRTIRTALESLGALLEQEKDYTGQPLGIITQAMDDGIRRFQSENDLKVDGKINPDGETIQKINQKLAEKTTREAETNASNKAEQMPVPPQKPQILSGQKNEDIIKFVSEWEQDKEHLYKDSKGNVTIGMGRMIPSEDNATTLNLKIKDQNGMIRQASEEEARQAFKKVKNYPLSNAEASHYDPKENPKLDMVYIDPETSKVMAMTDLLYHADALRRNVPNFEKLDPDVQKAMLDMRYNMGGGNFNMVKWNKFFKAVDAQDWFTAAKESNRKDISDERNKAIYDLIINVGKRQRGNN